MDSESCELKDFSLKDPALIVKWKLKNRSLPLQNRHLRALSESYVNGKFVSSQLVAWAKQHLEWTLESGAIDHPDGVLMLVVDSDGQAVMSTGPYEPLGSHDALALANRAIAAQSDIFNGGISSEIIWAVNGNNIVCGAQKDEYKCAMTSLVLDLINTLKLEVAFDDMLAEKIKDGQNFDEVFLSSDVYRIVVASNTTDTTARRLKELVDKLF